jgi:hypothetical protein
MSEFATKRVSVGVSTTHPLRAVNSSESNVRTLGIVVSVRVMERDSRSTSPVFRTWKLIHQELVPEQLSTLPSRSSKRASVPWVAVGVEVLVGVAVLVDVLVDVAVPVGVRVEVAVGVGVRVGVAVLVEVLVDVTLPTGVRVDVAVDVRVEVVVGVRVAVRVGVMVRVGVREGVDVGGAVNTGINTAAP